MVESTVWDESTDEGAVVHLVSATTEPKLSENLTQRLIDCLRDVAASLPGFLEGRVFQEDNGARVVVMTHWETRYAWAKAQWSEAIGRVLAEMYQSAVKVEMMMAYQRAVVEPRRS
jgi:heme-degrading monooxygenase HmoA